MLNRTTIPRVLLLFSRCENEGRTNSSATSLTIMLTAALSTFKSPFETLLKRAKHRAAVELASRAVVDCDFDWCSASKDFFHPLCAMVESCCDALLIFLIASSLCSGVHKAFCFPFLFVRSSIFNVSASWVASVSGSEIGLGGRGWMACFRMLLVFVCVVLRIREVDGTGIGI